MDWTCNTEVLTRIVRTVFLEKACPSVFAACLFCVCGGEWRFIFSHLLGQQHQGQCLKKVNKLIRKADSVLGTVLKLLEPIEERKMLRKVINTKDNAAHPLHNALSSVCSGSGFFSSVTIRISSRWKFCSPQQPYYLSMYLFLFINFFPQWANCKMGKIEFPLGTTVCIHPLTLFFTCYASLVCTDCWWG